MALEDKIKYSIDLIRKGESLALQMNPDGYYLAFSGGKDSQVIYELAKMAGVKFRAYMNMTTIDPPEVIRFIREKYPDVTMVRPEKSFFKLIETNQLPTMKARWCCKNLKEINGKNNVVIIGIRKAESSKRAKRNEFEESHNCRLNKFFLSPILYWTDADIWNYLRNNIGYWCKLYDNGYKRIGCIGCPYSPPKQRRIDFINYPKYKTPIIKKIKKLMDKGKYCSMENSEDVFDWWISGKSQKEYLAMKNQTKIDWEEQKNG